MDDGIPVNSATFTDGETWFELIGTAGRTFSCVLLMDLLKLCKGKRGLFDGADVEEIADV